MYTYYSFINSDNVGMRYFPTNNNDNTEHWDETELTYLSIVLIVSLYLELAVVKVCELSRLNSKFILVPQFFNARERIILRKII